MQISRKTMNIEKKITETMLKLHSSLERNGSMKVINIHAGEFTNRCLIRMKEIVYRINLFIFFI
jgi:hypothetical protein